jgi:phage protein U
MWAGSPWADRPWGDGPAVSGGLPTIAGTFSATESGSDTAAMTGKVRVSGSFAVTESGSDTASFLQTASASTIRFDITTGRLVKIINQSVCISF